MALTPYNACRVSLWWPYRKGDLDIIGASEGNIYVTEALVCVGLFLALVDNF